MSFLALLNPFRYFGGGGGSSGSGGRAVGGGGDGGARDTTRKGTRGWSHVADLAGFLSCAREKRVRLHSRKVGRYFRVIVLIAIALERNNDRLVSPCCSAVTVFGAARLCLCGGVRCAAQRVWVVARGRASLAAELFAMQASLFLCAQWGDSQAWLCRKAVSGDQVPAYNQDGHVVVQTKAQASSGLLTRGALSRPRSAGKGFRGESEAMFTG